MATTVYGNTTNHWRSYMTYTAGSTNNNTTYSVNVSAAGMQSVAWGFSISSGIHVVLSATNADSSSSTWNGGFSSPSGATVSKSFGSRVFSWSKGHSAVTKTVKITVTNSSGYMNGTSSKSVTVTVPAKPSYMVKYDANGGSGAPSSQTKWYNETLTLSSTNPTRTGYTFLGWATSATATSATYAAGASYTANAAATLYAVWQGSSYTITYNGNGSTGGSTSSQTKTYGVSLTLRENGFTRTNYAFTGWNTAADGGGTAYAAGGTYTANAAATLYAQWGIDGYTVTYNANGGSGAPAAQTKPYNQALTLSTTKPTRTGYTFYSWNTMADGTGTSYQAGGTIAAEVNQNIELYAQWATNTYVVSYNANGGADAPAAQTKAHDVALTLSSQRPTRTGFTFYEWNTAPDGTGTNFAAGGSYTANAAATLYAQWTSAYVAPRVTVLTAERCNAGGTLDDGGSHCFVTVGYAADTSISSTNKISTVSVTVNGTTDTRIVDAVSGTLSFVHSAYVDVAYSYAVSATITDTFMGGTATATATLPKPGLTLDFASGGNGIGIGTVAPASGLHIAWDITADGDLNSAGNVTLYDGAGSPRYQVRSELVDRDSDTAPSSWQYADGMMLYDKDGERVGRIYTVWNTSNAMGTGIEAITEDSNGNEVMNFLRVWANKDGTKTYSVGDKDNFRSAISAARASWVSLGTATGTGSRTIDLTNYSEVMVAAKANGKMVTAVVAKQLLTSSTQELWLGGGKSSGSTANSGNLRAVVNISLTTVKGVDFSEGSTNRTSSTTWYVYAR